MQSKKCGLIYKSSYFSRFALRQFTQNPPNAQELRNNKRKLDLEEVLKARFFYTPAYEIYGGVKGLYDYGPPGCSVLQNILTLWREWFILEDNMHQIHTSSLTPEVVFQSSGHVQKFQDYMVRDTVTGEYYRADHLLEEKLDNILNENNLSPEESKRITELRSLVGGLTLSQLSEKFLEFKVQAPETNNTLSEPFPFNLMFSTQIGPTGKYTGYLRPETAQGIFVNFNRLLEYNGGKLPFAAAQIGPSYRNEISPRAGLMRVREFILAEIEHFLDPNNKNHEKYDSIKDVSVPILTRAQQEEGKGHVSVMKISEALESGIINNQTFAYYIARTYLFLKSIGIQEDKIRFREHLNNEMAHYAIGCFDTELYSSYGWVECCGLADRSAYDLSCHQKGSGKNHSAFSSFAEGPVEKEVNIIYPNKNLIGSIFKSNASKVFAFLASFSDEDSKILELQQTLEKDGKILYEGLEITKDMVSVKKEKKKISGVKFIPSVIEPSFGIGRILYTVLDQSFYVRPEDEQRSVLRLKPRVAPFITTILPLLSTGAMIKKSSEIELIVNGLLETILKKKLITTKIDVTGVAIGRRYARTDELGIPFGITVDFETLQNNTVTLRERDSTEQVRVPIDLCASLLLDIVSEEISWEEVKQRFPKQDPVKETNSE